MRLFKKKSKAPLTKEEKYECRDCYREAALYCGLAWVEKSGIPPELVKKFDKMYKAEYKLNHTSRKGYKVNIARWRTI